MKTVIVTGSDGVDHDVSKAAKAYADAVRKHLELDKSPAQKVLAECWYWRAAGIAETVGYMIGPRKRQAFLKEVQSAYGLETVVW